MRLYIQLLLLCLIISSCGSDEDCPENTRLINGNCVCDIHYEGESCDEERGFKFWGTWNAKRRCNLSTQFFIDSSFNISSRAIDSIVIQSGNLFFNYPIVGRIQSSTLIGFNFFQPPMSPILDASMDYVGLDSIVFQVDEVVTSGGMWPCTFILTK